MKDEIKKATQLAENELQEKRIGNFKNIIKNLLQKKIDKEQEKQDLEEEIKLIKQDIDDFKVGRLDKIKERHEINPKAGEVAPINITIINDKRRTIHPLKPWLWNYEIYWGYSPLTLSYTSGSSLVAGGTGLSNSVYLTGASSADFTGGSYSVNCAGSDSTGGTRIISL